MPSQPFKIIDFHNHFVGPEFALTTLSGVPAPQRAAWERINHSLSSPDALLASLESEGTACRVISTPMEFLQDEHRTVPSDVVPRINDEIAALVSAHRGRLFGLATVDAYGGDAAARELVRAVKDLGLRGVFVESAKEDLLPDAPEARPVLAAAAELGVPAFLHPVEDPALFGRFRRFGRNGVRLTRGTINAAALMAMMESGLFEKLPGLKVVVTSMALGGMILAGTVAGGSRLTKDVPRAERRQIYVDTTGMAPVMVRCALDLMGADRVLLGTDWPVVVEDSARIRRVLEECNLSDAEQRMIVRGNAEALLGIGHA